MQCDTPTAAELCSVVGPGSGAVRHQRAPGRRAAVELPRWLQPGPPGLSAAAAAGSGARQAAWQPRCPPPRSLSQRTHSSQIRAYFNSFAANSCVTSFLFLGPGEGT